MLHDLIQSGTRMPTRIRSFTATCPPILDREHAGRMVMDEIILSRLSPDPPSQAPSDQSFHVEDTRSPEHLAGRAKVPSTGDKGQSATTDPSTIYLFNGIGPADDILLRLTESLDLSSLRSLDIAPSYGFEETVFAQAARRLPHLERLFITFARTGLVSHAWSPVRAIMSMRPLKFLCLHGLRDVSQLHLVLSRHGPTLHGLIIGGESSYVLSPIKVGSSDVTQMAVSCPNLRELRLEIKRRGGSVNERRMYESLANFTALRSLILDLYCDVQPLTSPPDSSTSPSLLREILVNTATDKELVESIQRIICSKQKGRTLRNLCCVPFVRSTILRHEEYVHVHLCWSYLSRRVDSDEDWGIVEVGKAAREL
ncbi:uncharacterized protein BJX67DRAFT_297645 [Aspergillus lucknowensis]|uniref:Uncharacterized protein n=1 Tax=Aspergillus lucknowensis TaxID=176173 RepID=A0ABR4LD19_9EURO